MTKTIPFIGYNNALHKWVLNEIAEEMGIKGEPIKRADDGLAKITAEQFPLIFVNEEVAKGLKMNLPEGMCVDDYTGIACHVISEIRKSPMNADSKVVVLYHQYKETSFSDDDPYLRPYLAAGADGGINLVKYGVKPPTFVDKLKEFLPQ